MIFKIGDQVECLSGNVKTLTRGKLYRISSIDRGRLVEIINDEGNYQFYENNRFIPKRGLWMPDGGPLK